MLKRFVAVVLIVGLIFWAFLLVDHLTAQENQTISKQEYQNLQTELDRADKLMGQYLRYVNQLEAQNAQYQEAVQLLQNLINRLTKVQTMAGVDSIMSELGVERLSNAKRN